MRKWNRIGHVLRMQNNIIFTTALTWHPEGRRKVGRPKKKHGTELQSRKDHSWGGIERHQRRQQPKSGTGGGSVSGPYVSAGMMRLDEDCNPLIIGKKNQM